MPEKGSPQFRIVLKEFPRLLSIHGPDSISKRVFSLVRCNAMNSESLVKGGIAEHIVEILLEQSGYTVTRIGREGLLARISRSQTDALNQSDSAGKITTAPSFAVFNKKGNEVTLVRIKYRGEKSRGRNISHGLKQLVNYWPEAALILVTPIRPCFRAVLGEGREIPIEQLFSQIKKETLAQGIGLVTKFL